MTNLDSITNKNNTKHNEKCPYIAGHPYRLFWTRKNKYIS